MIKSIRALFSVFLQLLSLDLAVFLPTYTKRLIDFFIYVAVNVLVMGYLLTRVGMPANFGMFIAASCVGISGRLETFSAITRLVVDLTGNKIISYDLTLPLPSWLAVIRIAISDALRCLSLGIFALPFGAVLVFSQFDAALFSPFLFVALLFLNALFYGFFGLFFASFPENIGEVDMIWMRYLFPMWMMGCFQFSWQTLYGASPAIAYLMLLNPFVYPVEGMRAAILGQAGSLPFWMCFLATLGFTIVFGAIGVRRILKCLDAV